MLKKIITYTDFDGNKQSKECYFHYTKTDLTRMNLAAEGGLLGMAEKISSEKDGKKLCQLFEDIILGAYGERTADGQSFVKTDEVRQAFRYSLAYDALFEELSTDAKKFAEFFNGIIPSDSKISDDKLAEVVAQANAKMGQ